MDTSSSLFFSCMHTIDQLGKLILKKYTYAQANGEKEAFAQHLQ